MTVVILPALEAIRYVFKSEPRPVMTLILVLPIIGLATFKLYQLRQRLLRLRMASDGEKVVGQFLEELRSRGHRVFHDVVGDGFNVDHVVISDRGIFTIETKTYRKPATGKPEIRFDGQTILLNGHPTQADIIGQVRAQAAWSRRVLQESTGKDYPVKPVVLFPGWFIQQVGESLRSGIWVLNPKALPTFLEHEPVQLNPEDVKLAAYHLSRYIRAQYR